MLASSLRDARGRRGSMVALVLVVAAAGAVGCGQQNTEGRSPSYLIVESLQGASGATPGTYAGSLDSDVVTNVKTTVGDQEVLQATVFEDIGQVKLRMALKDGGNGMAVASPTPVNAVTVTRYHVDFKRSDGRSTPGVDVPYGFDGAATGTIGADGAVLSFVLVRAQAKLEAPLRALRSNGGAIVISTVAEVTFYGTDQNGNTVSVVGMISVNFADWGDPSSSGQ